MDRTTARQIIKKTFQNPFNKDSFVYFVKNLLNYIEEAPFIYRGNFIPDAFDSYIKTLERVGKYQDPEDKQIDVLIVRLKKESSLEHARTMQRNFIAWYLNGSRGGKLKDAALVAFVAPNGKDWRFSLVEMEYKLAKTQTGRVRAKEELTPARRYSFLVGIHESSHTAQSRLVPILEDDVNNPTLKQLEESFNVEKVTKEFFEKYRGLYHWIKEELDAIISKNPAIKKDFNEKSISTVDFAKKLLGQIIFLYFLQKKGWFGVKRGEDWGMGSKRFLRELFEKKHGDYKNFFNEILEPLFYEALRLERPGDYYSRFDCRIPFLNGGLFDPINDYDWWNTDILLHNDLFSNEIKTKEGDIGTGILDIFDRYNFTVKEDEPLEKEVAVDPEMLGKVFENLLEVKDRKSKGTYYTPREIVHYMCQESLVNYLATELSSSVIPAKAGIQNPAPTREDIETLIKYGETTIEHDTAYIEKKSKKEKTKVYSKAKLPKSIEKNTKLIDEKLATIRVCDPAVGSGAFLVGMMNEIIRTRNALTPYLALRGAEATKQSNSNCHSRESGNPEYSTRSIYNFKRHAIQNCLYGVDIDLGAVEIAKLRLWLSLIVDEDDIKQIRPLPNLDYKIMQGNSLLENLVIGNTIIKFNLDDAVKLDRRTKEMKNLFEKESQTKLFKDKSEDIFDELQKLHSLYFEENNKNKKLQLKQRIDEKEELLIAAKCDEEIQRLETVKKNTLDRKKQKEIDNQIANIRSTLQNLKKQSVKPFFLWKLHFADVFQEKGGFDVVIANPPYIDSESMVKEGQANLREAIQKIYSFTRGNWDIYIAFLELAFKKINDLGVLTFITPDKWISKPFGDEFRKNTIKNIYLIARAGRGVFESSKIDSIISFFSKKQNSKIKILEFKDKIFIEKREVDKKVITEPFALDWLFSDYLDLLIRINLIPTKASDLGICENACATSDAYKLEPLIKNSVKFDVGNQLKIINTGTIGKYYSKWGKQEMTYLGHKYLNPVVEKRQFLDLFKNTYAKKSIKSKIILKGLNLLDACLDMSGDTIPGKSTLIVVSANINELKLLLAIINSQLTYFYLKEKFVASSYNQGISFTKEMINNLPIPRIVKKDRNLIIKIVDKIFAITKDNDYLQNPTKQAKVHEYEKQIDQMVYNLYGLTKEEIKIVENNEK